MYKNILIIGSSRSGKTSLAKKIAKEKYYNLISIDDIVSGLSAYPDLDIHHNGDTFKTTKNLVPFLKNYFIELSEGSTFYNGIKFVVEGVQIDFDELIPFLQSDRLKDKYLIIGLTYNHITEEELFNNIKKYDTEDDWTYWCRDDELKGNVKYFIETNAYLDNMFKKHNIITFDTSFEREKVLDDIVRKLEELDNGKKDTN